MDKKFVINSLKEFNRNIPVYGGNRYFSCWLDLIWSFFRFGCSPNCYFHYEFNRKSNYEKNKFLTYGRSKKVVRKYNNPEKIINVYDKRLSYRLFADFISREWLDTGSCKYDDFQRFVLKHREIIVKPAKGRQGRGICKYSYREGDNLERKFKEIKGLLVEEVLEQDEKMRSLNPSSVNTARIVTFHSGHSACIIGCYLRMGMKESIVDNLSAGGIAAGIDVETGIVFTPGISEELKRYLVHPLSGVQIIGFRIPNWEMVLEIAKKAASLVPETRYIGWDIAVLNGGAELIESNYESGHVVQIIDQRGLYEPIRNILNSE